MKQSEKIAILLSTCALIISFFSIYIPFFYKPNSVSVIIEGMFLESEMGKGSFYNDIMVLPLIFINDGKRANTITYAEISTYTKRYTGAEINPQSGERPHIITFHTRKALEPFVLYPGDVLYKRVEIKLSDALKRHNDESEKVEVGAHFTTVTDNGKRIKSGLIVGNIMQTETKFESSWYYKNVNLLRSSTFGRATKPMFRANIDNQ